MEDEHTIERSTPSIEALNRNATLGQRPSLVQGINKPDTPLTRIAEMVVNLKYEDMMEYAKGLFELAEKNKQESPDQVAANLHAWGKLNANSR